MGRWEGGLPIMPRDRGRNLATSPFAAAWIREKKPECEAMEPILVSVGFSPEKTTKVNYHL
jgi:hypothetical protein